jgi:hypothetical protein
MPLEPPSSAGWPPDEIVNAIDRLARKQRLINLSLLLMAAGALIVAIVSLVVK